MTTRVVLITPALNRALREARFDDGCPLDPAGERSARAAAGSFPMSYAGVHSPSVRCHETAAALGLGTVPRGEVAGLDVGRWRGRTLGELSGAEPDAVGAWLTDPACAPHGGESVADLCARVGGWLGTLADSATTLAVVEPEVARAAVVRALGAPESALWRVDVPPLTATELSGRSGRWNVRIGRPLGPDR